MSWVKHTPPPIRAHRCEPPMRDHTISPPRGPAPGHMPPGKTIEDYPQPKPHKIGERPDGNVGDLWRCDECGTLWRIGRPEPQRYQNVFPNPYPRWREANWWTRRRY